MIKNRLAVLLALLLSASFAAIDQAVAAEHDAGGITPFSSLSGLLDKVTGQTSEQEEFLEPDKAYRLTVSVIDGRTLQAEFEIANGYYLYRDKTKFQLQSEGATLGAYTLPKGKTKVDEFFGKQEVYYKSLIVDLPLRRQTDNALRANLLASYQGCAEGGVCYPPINKTISLVVPPVGPDAARQDTGPATESAPAQGVTLSEEERVKSILRNSTVWLTVGFFFLAGLGLAFTPCVFPMIPILSGIIVGHGKDVTRKKAFSLSLSYVFGMAITYTIAGVIAGLTGELLSSAFQNPWVLGAFALIFVLLALSMFGFYDLRVPTSLQAKLSAASSRFQGGAITGVFVMGVLSALIVGPCVAAPLTGALLYIGQTGDVVLGGTALFALSMGMGTPLLIVGTSAGALMPKAGPWMERVMAVFGVLLLGVAVWMISRVIPPEATLMLYALLLIIPAVYLHALDAVPEGVSGWTRLWKGTGVVMLLYGVMLFIGAFTGAKDPLDPLAGIRSFGGGAASVSRTARELEFVNIKGAEQLNSRVAQAAGRPVMLDFYADWCVECVRLENTTFKDPAVQQALSSYVLLRSDVTLNDNLDKALLKQFNLYGPPALLFFGPNGKEMRSYRLIGYKDPNEFLQHLAQFGKT